MPEKIREVHPPRGLGRLAFRLPLWLYRMGLGRLLGKRFVWLTHTGRRSGQARQTVLEIVRYDRATGACIVAAGFGERSDWARNVTCDSQIIFAVGRNRRKGLAKRLDPETAGSELAIYSRRFPLAWNELVKVMGYRLNGSEEDVRSLGATIPMFVFKPVDAGKLGIK